MSLWVQSLLKGFIKSVNMVISFSLLPNYIYEVDLLMYVQIILGISGTTYFNNIVNFQNMVLF